MAGGYADRCGPGPRQPLVVISPYASRRPAPFRIPPARIIELCGSGIPTSDFPANPESTAIQTRARTQPRGYEGPCLAVYELMGRPVVP